MKLFNRLTKLYHNFLRIFFRDTHKSVLIIFFCLFLIYAILPLFFYPDMMLYRIYYVSSKILIWTIIFLTPIYILLKFRIRYVYNKIQSPSLKRDHLAIIVVKYDSFFKSMFYMFINLFRFLHKLRSSKIPFSVYVVDNRKQFMDVIYNKNVKVLFIFGHGQKHGIKFGNELWHYCSIPKVSHIRFVTQFHCNHYSGKSLHEHFGCNGSFITEDVTIYHDINKFIDSEEYLENLKKLLKV